MVLQNVIVIRKNQFKIRRKTEQNFSSKYKLPGFLSSIFANCCLLKLQPSMNIMKSSNFFSNTNAIMKLGLYILTYPYFKKPRSWENLQKQLNYANKTGVILEDKTCYKRTKSCLTFNINLDIAYSYLNRNLKKPIQIMNNSK